MWKADLVPGELTRYILPPVCLTLQWRLGGGCCYTPASERSHAGKYITVTSLPFGRLTVWYILMSMAAGWPVSKWLGWKTHRSNANQRSNENESRKLIWKWKQAENISSKCNLIYLCLYQYQCQCGNEEVVINRNVNNQHASSNERLKATIYGSYWRYVEAYSKFYLFSWLSAENWRRSQRRSQYVFS